MSVLPGTRRVCAFSAHRAFGTAWAGSHVFDDIQANDRRNQGARRSIDGVQGLEKDQEVAAPKLGDALTALALVPRMCKIRVKAGGWLRSASGGHWPKGLRAGSNSS